MEGMSKGGLFGEEEGEGHGRSLACDVFLFELDTSLDITKIFRRSFRILFLGLPVYSILFEVHSSRTKTVSHCSTMLKLL